MQYIEYSKKAVKAEETDKFHLRYPLLKTNLVW